MSHAYKNQKLDNIKKVGENEKVNFVSSEKKVSRFVVFIYHSLEQNQVKDVLMDGGWITGHQAPFFKTFVYQWSWISSHSSPQWK